MRVKRYIVETMPVAMQQIRSELGQDAVILSTKDIYLGGFLGMFRKKRIEVIAAVDKASSPTTRSEPRKLRPEAAAESPQISAESFAAAMASATSQAAAAYRAPYKAQEAVNSQPIAVSTGSSDQVSPQLEKQQLLELLNKTQLAEDVQAASAKSPATQSGRTDQSAQGQDNLLFDELRQVKEAVAKLTRLAGSDPYEESWQQFKMKLTDQDISPELAEVWLQAYRSRLEEQQSEPGEEAFDQFVKEQLTQLITPAIDAGISSETRIIYIAGPTGVGKTTTIAKLAAEQLFKHQRKVGLITSDTYRIAAVEQLRTYATILNIPVEVVNSPADLMRAVKNLESCDLIFMDTAGRNFRNDMLVSELNSLLKPMEHSETYLVLSLTSKYKDMKMIVDNFSKFKLDKLIFTKLDETACYGSMVNLIHEYPLKLSYIANGQNVPEDIELATTDRLIQLILGERNNG